MEITPVQHPFVRAVNDSNVHAIMMNTGAKIIFPDLTDGNIQQIKRSRVYISGEINCVYNARQQLVVSIKLCLLFISCYNCLFVLYFFSGMSPTSNDF
jgi:protein bicaudal C